MKTIIINDTNLHDDDIQKFGNKVRAVLLSVSNKLDSSSNFFILSGCLTKSEITDEDTVEYDNIFSTVPLPNFSVTIGSNIYKFGKYHLLIAHNSYS